MTPSGISIPFIMVLDIISITTDKKPPNTTARGNNVLWLEPNTNLTTCGMIKPIKPIVPALKTIKPTSNPLSNKYLFFSLVISNLGVDSIIKISAPILSLIYPATIVLIVMTIFKKFFKNDNIVKFSTYTALFMGILMAINDLGINIPVLDILPLANLGFCWVVPTFVGGFVGYFIKSNRNYELEEDEEIAI